MGEIWGWGGGGAVFNSNVLFFVGNFYGSEIRHGICLVLNFGSWIFWGFVGSPRDIFGFDFCLHSIIPVT